MNARFHEDGEKELMVQWFEKSYDCSRCGNTWTDEWSCTCNDRCPQCDAETEPTSAIDLSRRLTAEDYIEAARFISRRSGEAAPEVTHEEAKAYAEAVLEGDADRFCPAP